jgi:hypothetical protein
LKPNARILLDIIAEIGADPNEVIYIGDSKMKDIVMANRAGVTSVYAKYGYAQDRPEYNLLRRVSHWTDYQIQRETFDFGRSGEPRVVLNGQFDEVLSHFEFQPFYGMFLQQHNGSADHLIDIWKKTVDVQQHFNDIELRIRQYAVTILGAIVGLSAVTLKEPMTMSLFGEKYLVAAALMIVAAATLTIL